jgi:hypothetical protein
MGGRNLFPEEAQPEKKGRNLFADEARPVTVFGSTIPGAQTTAPASVMGSPIPRLSEEELQRRRLLDQAQAAAARQADEERKAREAPVRAAANVAGREATLEGLSNTPAWAMGLGGPSATLAGQAASEDVYGQAGIVSPSAAREIRSFNSRLMGIPSLVNEDIGTMSFQLPFGVNAFAKIPAMRERIGQAGQDQPGAAMLGDIEGYLAPGAAVEAGVRGVGRAVQPIVNRFAPTGGSMLERGTRVGGRTVGLGASGATQSGVYQGTVGESIAAAEEGRAPSLAGAAEGFTEGATDPFAVLALPALMGANRLLTYVRSGGTTATPANIAAQIDQATGRLLNPRRAIGQTLDMDLAGPDIRPQAMDRIVRELESAGLTTEDIGRLMESVQERLSSLPEAQASRLTFGQALAEATARDRPQALPTILSTLRERRLSGRKGDTSAGIISGVTRDLEGSQIDFLSNSIGRNIGDTTLPEVDEQIRLAKAAISNQYNQVLAQADPTRPEARGLAMIVAGDKSKGVLSRRATNAGFENVDAYIAARPDEAAHWLRSRLAKDARTAQGRERGELETTVAQLDELLETNEGYRQARQQWGFESGLEDAQDWAKNFTNIARDEGAVADLIGELNRMPEAQRNVAMSSLRNEILKSVRGGPEDASLRLSKWMTRGALDALEQLGEGGRALADDLRFLGREQRWLFKVDPETLSPTAVRMLSAQTAQQAGNAPMSNVMAGAGQPNAAAFDIGISAITGTPLPLMTTQRALSRAGDFIFRPRTETLQDVSRLYMGRRGNIPTPTEEPDFTPLFNRGASTRTVGAAPAAAPNAFASGQPAGPGTAQQGFGNAFAESALGSAGGSALGSRTDFNGDGVIDEQDMLIGAAGGGLGVPAVTGAMRRGGTVGVPRGRSMGMGGDVPTTPQQAARAELPGSTEYEAAKAKGLDMSQAGRMARAKEMGFDTETVLYHGSSKEFDAFKEGDRGIFFGAKETASDYGEAQAYYVRGKMAPRSVVVQVKKEIKADRAKSVFSRFENERPHQQRELVKRLKKLGYDGYSQGMGIPGALGETVIFDPSNIRSVNAAFDPDNAASPQLLAGFGKDLLTAGAAGATIGGAMIARDEMLDQPRDNALAVPEPSPAPINPNMPRNAVARTYGAPQAPLDQQDPDDPRNFGVESFEDLRPNDPLRDPWFRRQMIQRGMRYQANEATPPANAFAR